MRIKATTLDYVIAYSPYPLGRALYRRYRAKEFHRTAALLHAPPVDGFSLVPYVEHRAIFVRIPKTAGTSVARSLFGSDGGAHRSVADYRIAFNPQEFREFFKFAFVRNPWERVHSAYHYLRRGGGNKWDQQFGERLLRFDSFADFVCHGLHKRSVRGWIHFVPQHRFICLPGRRHPAVDFIGRYERLAEDYEIVAARVPDATALRRDNVTTDRPDYRDEYGDRSRDIVRRVYSRDIAMFGYEF